tara:strand:+ start:473 stop:619 length:147 start_codon:yes stop_codon:yes gene_type:complete
VPGEYCRKETTVEDDFHNDGLIFHYEEAHEGILGGMDGGLAEDVKKAM